MSRVQLALNVNDIDEAVTFYSKLFGAEPAKRRPGYANFAIAEPPLKLVLLENPGQGGSLNHLGIEVPDIDTVDAEQTRLAGSGLASVDERATTCCYAKQDKFWVQGTPNGAVLGGLHRPGGQPDVLRRAGRPGVLRRDCPGVRRPVVHLRCALLLARRPAGMSDMALWRRLLAKCSEARSWPPSWSARASPPSACPLPTPGWSCWRTRRQPRPGCSPSS